MGSTGHTAGAGHDSLLHTSDKHEDSHAPRHTHLRLLQDNLALLQDIWQLGKLQQSLLCFPSQPSRGVIKLLTQGLKVGQVLQYKRGEGGEEEGRGRGGEGREVGGERESRRGGGEGRREGAMRSWECSVVGVRESSLAQGGQNLDCVNVTGQQSWRLNVPHSNKVRGHYS